jgi:hypothetical protein
MKNYPAAILSQQPVAINVSSDGYLVAVKPSARRVSARAGQWVNRHGPTRRFDSKAMARDWARVCSEPTVTVWVQDAPDWADDDTDGYLVGYRHGDARTVAPGQQATIPDGDG